MKFYFLAVVILLATSCASLASIPFNDVESYLRVDEHRNKDVCASCHTGEAPYPTQKVLNGEPTLMDLVARKRRR